jgi:hypothetical protein
MVLLSTGKLRDDAATITISLTAHILLFKVTTDEPG